VDAFLPSRSELADLVDYDDPEQAIAELSALPTPIIVVKMGAEGSLVWDRAAGEIHRVGPVPGVRVVDVTGAGDAFCGGFAAGLSLGCNALEAAQRGSVSAAFGIAGFGSLRLARVGPDDARKVLKESPPEVRPVPPPVRGDQVEVEGADRGIKSSVDTMREEIGMIPGLLRDLPAQAEQLLRLARGLAGSGIGHLYLTGCGDSAFAGAAAALAFRAYAGVEAEGIHALDLARYRVRYLPPRSAVVCISFSGKVGRTIEAAVQARRFGHRVIVLTGNADSPLAQEADDIITLSVPTLGYSPGTSTYLALLSALFELAVSWAEETGRDTADARMLLEAMPDLARRTLEAAEAPSRDAAQRLAESRWVTFLGAGPNEPTARFGAAKLFEGPGMLGVATNIEEWAHEEYFISGQGTPVVMVAPDGASYDRAAEILSELRAIGADAIVIGDHRPPLDPTTFIPIAPGLPEALSPLLTALPLSLLAFHLAQARGQASFEFASPEAAQEHYETIHRATVGEPA
jgi:glucosamine--fructose-6-phosphate aminotransferase (isomerizing)